MIMLWMPGIALESEMGDTPKVHSVHTQYLHYLMHQVWEVFLMGLSRTPFLKVSLMEMKVKFAFGFIYIYIYVYWYLIYLL